MSLQFWNEQVSRWRRGRSGVTSMATDKAWGGVFMAAKTTRVLTMAALCVIVGGGLLACGADAKTTKSGTATPPAPVLSGNIPLDVTPPSGSTPEQARPWFDTFSWQSFIALNWPVTPTWPEDPKTRGMANAPNDPSVFKSAANGTTTVWGSYKEAVELFSTGDKRPSAWTSNGDPLGLCATLPPGSKKMVMINKGGTLLNGINEAFSFPLIDQNKNYAWTEVRYNQAQYDFIRGTDGNSKSWLYLIKNLADAQNAGPGGAISMPESKEPSTQGAIMLKATWREMTNKDDPDRYYVVDAYLYNSATGSCDLAKMGLVGFHIAQKLSTFPQWIWSTFEQVDNVQRGPGASDTTPISFNNGTSNPATVGGFANRPKVKAPPLVPKASRTPVQVTRFNPIPVTPAGWSTVDLNKTYQKLLGGTVWRNYELVITQWPTVPQRFLIQDKGGIYPQDSGQPFPVNGATNAVLETYFQSAEDAAGAGGNSCMSCHYDAARSDFSWVLQLRAHQ